MDQVEPAGAGRRPVARRRLRVAGAGSCYACHSNETDWPLYSYVAPALWLVRSDVEAGRDELNFSEWGENSDADDAAESIAEGSLPPGRCTLLDPGARLTDAERQQSDRGPRDHG